jgi:hypothetical protein
MKMRAVMKFLSTPVRQMTLIPSILCEIRTYYKKAYSNENACGNEILISSKMDGTRIIYLTGVAKHIKLAIIYVLGIILNQFSKYAPYQVPSDNLVAFFFRILF